MNREEMEKWLKARGWAAMNNDFEEYSEWFRDWGKEYVRTIKIEDSIFARDGKLINFDYNEWDENWVSFEDVKKETETLDDLDDEIPF